MQIREVPVASLTEDPKNARRHPDQNTAAIRASLRDFGQRLPLLVRAGVVVAGNGRLRAMRELGWEKCSVLDADDMTEEQARAFALVDNRTSELATWDVSTLQAAIDDLDERLDVSSYALSDIDLDAILKQMIEAPKKAEINQEEARRSLSERFVVPPFSVLDARQGYWQDRKRAWLALGIQSEIGRGGAPGGSPRPAARLTENGHTVRGDGRGREI